MVQRIERTQTSTVLDSDEEPLLPHEHDRVDVQSAASTVFAVRSPPPGATHLEDVTNTLGAALGLDPVPSSGDVDDEAVPDHVNSTFLVNFELDLDVLCTVVDVTINDGVRAHFGAVPEVGVPSASHEFVSVAAVVPAHAGVGFNRKVRSFGRRGQR